MYHGNHVYSGEYFTHYTWCNKKMECNNGGVDEKYCREEEEEEVFGCTAYGISVYRNIRTSKVCNRKCDCNYCDDEWQCGGYNYHYWYKCSNRKGIIASYRICDSYKNCPNGDDESNCKNVTMCIGEKYSSLKYLLANYSRCTPKVWCANKLDHTNCSDTTLAPLQCHIGGYIFTVSQDIVCKKEVHAPGYALHSNSSTVCDDGIDMQCVTPTPGCYIHKQQLCDNITDCKNGSDEKIILCYRATSQYCAR